MEEIRVQANIALKPPPELVLRGLPQSLESLDRLIERCIQRSVARRDIATAFKGAPCRVDVVLPYHLLVKNLPHEVIEEVRISLLDKGRLLVVRKKSLPDGFSVVHEVKNERVLLL